MMAEEDRVRVELGADGVEASHAVGELSRFTTGERAIRAGVVLLAAAMLAAALVPIPIIHLVGIPLVLGIGVVLAVRQFRSVARLAPLRMPCPKCGAENLLGGGLGYRSATGPISRNCESCRRPLVLSFSRP